MKVVLRSSSLLFTVLTITLNAPVARVRRKEVEEKIKTVKKPPVREETFRESKYWNRTTAL